MYSNRPQILQNSDLIPQTFGQCDCGGGDCGYVHQMLLPNLDIRKELSLLLYQRGLLSPVQNIALPEDDQETLLTAWLHLTDRCNFRCSYCYLPHHVADMSFETGQTAIAATFRSAVKHGYRRVKLKYAGGEPLLRFSVMTALHQYAQRVAEKHELAVDGVILSNGTLLTPDMLDMIRALNVRLMISLDGLGIFHDRQRRYANGTDSAKDVTQAVEFALEGGGVPDISITVSGHNIAGLPELMSWVVERDLPFSLNFSRPPSTSRHDDLRLAEETIIQGMFAAYKVIEANLPRRSLLASLSDRANLAMPHRRTCSVGQSYLVFDPQGRVAKCQMQMDHPVTSAAVADPLALVRQDRSGIQNLPVEDKEVCHSCQWNYWCAGGCPLTTYRATGRYDVKSPNCEIYKALYPEVIRLEGLRLLRYGQELQE